MEKVWWARGSWEGVREVEIVEIALDKGGLRRRGWVQREMWERCWM